ncbi:MAG TPA: hypothetical protein VIG25_03485 [Pyrinomonadaceae bacterium]
MTRKLLPVICLVLAIMIAVAWPSAVNTKVTANTAGPVPTPTPWPDLTKIKISKSKKCGIDGAATPGTEKAKLNRLKNRFRLPSGQFEPITFDDLLALNQGHIQGNAIVGFPKSNDPDNKRAVSLVGFVRSVFTAGCTVHEHSQGESCNCNTINPNRCDAHIDVLPSENVNTNDGRNVYVVEITQRIRLLAAQGLLESNIGNDWSTQTLKTKLENHRVRFSGFLFFDTDHADQAWVSDPLDKIHSGPTGNNFRQTAWEIHPVMKIEVLN